MLRPLLPLIILGAGCASPAVRPRAGEAERPEVLVRRLRRALRTEDWRRAFDLLSADTQDQLGYTKFRLGFPKLGIAGTKLLIAEIISEGELLGILPFSPDARARSERRASGAAPRRCLLSFEAGKGEAAQLFQLLIIRQGPGGGRWRLAMQEQSEIMLPMLIGPAPKKKG